MRWASVIFSCARGVGKTHQTALATKAVKGTMVCYDRSQAKLLKQEHGIDTFAVTDDPDRLRGRRLPIMFDPDAVCRIVGDYENEIGRLEKQVQELKARNELLATRNVELLDAASTTPKVGAKDD